MDKLIINEESIKNKIYTIRGIQVMLDRDLAELYGVKPIRLREQVKRNIKRFPEDFMFQLDENEIDFMVSQNAIPSKQHLGGSKPYVFTEQGVSMLSAILKTDFAIEISIKIIETFVAMRKHLASNSLMFERFERIEQRLLVHDEKFDTIFKTLEDKSIKPTQGIFYDGQIFDN
jgi:phage regulator Rha-like protein